jgi:hypothetical protein
MKGLTHIKRFNESEEKDDMRTYSPWDKIYNHYTRECLNSDGDFSMSFIDWLKINYPDGSPR